jgi:hypothetical protein
MKKIDLIIKGAKTSIILGLAVLLILGSVSSCNEDDLDLTPQTPTETDLFAKETDFEMAVIGVYSSMNRWYVHQNDQNNIVYPIWHLPGDDVTTVGSNAFEIFTNINAGNTPVDHFYTSTFQLIARANVVLEKIEGVEEDVYQTENLESYHRGEALFLRGLAYYHLWNVFGSAPPLVLTSVITGNPAYPSSSEGTGLLDQAISDFAEAATLLPLSWADAQVGRATKNSANGYSVKALVFRASVTGNKGDYEAAITAFNNLSGVSLIAQFGDNFAFDTENNVESLFEFQATETPGCGCSWAGESDPLDETGVMSVYWDLLDPNAGTLFGLQPLVATDKLIDAFDAEDPRLELTVDPLTNFIQKYVSRNSMTGANLGSVNNPRLLRYADVVLLKAEALLFSGGSKSEAIGLINDIRTRAREINGSTAPANYDTAETDESTIFEWIRNERFLELAAEGQRWWDLRRWELGGMLPNDLNNLFFDSKNANLNFNLERHLNFPLPTSETDQNPNVTQNIGY